MKNILMLVVMLASSVAFGSEIQMRCETQDNKVVRCDNDDYLCTQIYSKKTGETGLKCSKWIKVKESKTCSDACPACCCGHRCTP